MAFLKKLFGGSFESNRKDGEMFMANRQFGEARLAFQRALKRSKEATESNLDVVRKAVRSCEQELAFERLAEADRLAEEGDVETALAVLDDIQEISNEPEVIDGVRERRVKYESQDARQLVNDGDEIGDDELIAVIAGTWSAEQAREYAQLPESFREALLADHDQEPAKAGEILAQIAGQADLPVTPCYLWLELGRVQTAAGLDQKALESLDRFLETAGKKEQVPTDQCVFAHRLRAGALARLERYDDAKEALALTTRLALDDHTTHLSLGVFLRNRGELEGAKASLEKAAQLMGQMNPDFRVIRELGFTYLAMGRDADAKYNLGAVIEHQASRGEHQQLDPEAAIALAALHEKNGDFVEASDLFRHLAVGFDTKNHFLYNFQSARLLSKSKGNRTLVERYLTRAEELAESEEQRGQLQQLRERL